MTNIQRTGNVMISMSILQIVGVFIVGGSLGFVFGALVQSRLDKKALNRQSEEILRLDQRLADITKRSYSP